MCLFLWAGVTTENSLDHISSLENMFPVNIGLPDVIFYYRLHSWFIFRLLFYCDYARVIKDIKKTKLHLTLMIHCVCRASETTQACKQGRSTTIRMRCDPTVTASHQISLPRYVTTPAHRIGVIQLTKNVTYCKCLILQHAISCPQAHRILWNLPKGFSIA